MELQAGGVFQLSLLMFRYEIGIKSKFNLIEKISRKPLIAIIFIIQFEEEGKAGDKNLGLCLVCTYSLSATVVELWLLASHLNGL